MLMIRSTIIILPLVFTYFIISLKNKNESHFYVKCLVLMGILLIKEYKSIVNGSIKALYATTCNKDCQNKIF